MTSRKSEPDDAACPCGSGAEYLLWCGRILNGGEVPQTAEQLMRSRCCGFILCDEAYLKATWYPNTRPSRVRLDEQHRWLGLKIRATEAGGPDEFTGCVEFVARFKVNSRGHRLHEISRFEKIDGRWYYSDGQHH